MSSKLTEDQVNDYAAKWLEDVGYEIVDRRKGTAKGEDIQAKSPDGILLFVECKGYVSPKGNVLPHWRKSAEAVFNTLRDACRSEPGKRFAIAIPNADEYKDHLQPLKALLVSVNVAVLFFDVDGNCEVWGW